MIEVRPVPILADNLAYLLLAGRRAAVVDPGEPGPVAKEIRARGLRLEEILLTHHHGDHIGGAEDLAKEFGARIRGPQRDGIDFIDEDLVPGACRILGGAARVFEVPGHTRHHVAIFLPVEGDLFAGDILFIAGCGRLFEGSAGEMWKGIETQILPLPDETRLWPGHDYALRNLPFAESLLPGDADLAALRAEAEETARGRRPFVPRILRDEKRTNPFLRAADTAYRAAIATHLGEVPDAVAAFAALRRSRDSF